MGADYMPIEEAARMVRAARREKDEDPISRWERHDAAMA
jgi:hypothetical protein